MSSDSEGKKTRLEGLNESTLRTRLAECDEALRKYVDEIFYGNLNWYVSRASLRYALGLPPADIADDLYLAARCIHLRGSMHLDRNAPEKFMTRRLLPVELALVSGQPAITTDIASEVGFSLSELLANTSEELHKEASRLTSYFRRGSCASHQDLAGLGAVTYAGALAAIARGFDDEAALGLKMFADARVPFANVRAEEPAASVLKRYDGLCLGLVCVLNGELDKLGHVVTAIVTAYLHDLATKLGKELASPSQPPRYLDLSAVAILAVAALRGYEVVLPDEGPLAGYRELYEHFMTAPPREAVQTSGLDEQSKEVLRSMGVSEEAINGPAPEGGEQA